jgi:hypothetical protein
LSSIKDNGCVRIILAQPFLLLDLFVRLGENPLKQMDISHHMGSDLHPLFSLVRCFIIRQEFAIEKG